MTLSFLARSLAVLAVGLVACATGGQVVEPKPESDKPAVAVEAAPDPFTDFEGDHIALGTEASVDSNGVAVDGARVVLRLTKVRTASFDLSGGDDAASGTAIFEVLRGAEAATLAIEQGDSGSALGVIVAVKAASVVYDDARMRYLPRATITVTSGR